MQARLVRRVSRDRVSDFVHPCHVVVALMAVALSLADATLAAAQMPTIHSGDAVPRDVREVYDRGLQYLAAAQTETGNWPAGEQGSGITGLGLMAFLASGEDPNFGLYSNHVRRSLRNIISSQNATTGFSEGAGVSRSSMYQHGFAMLALSEAYGTVDDRSLWSEGQGAKGLSIGQSLELAVRAAVTSQKNNSFGGWRYGPDARDADTSVSGSVLMGLLAARNAGVEVPDEAIDKAISYYRQMTSDSGQVAYAGGIGGFGESTARTSIATLVYAIARRKDLPQFKATLGHLTERLELPAQAYPEYTRYYQAQALFQGDVAAWEKWNNLLIRQLKSTQQSDGSFMSAHGPAFGTSMSLLALALNYRFLPIYER